MKKNNVGFTLIEVLIALAILSIALTAIIRSTSQNVNDTLYLQNKTTALWVGLQVMSEVRLGLLKLPPAPEKFSKNTNMLNQDWPWQANLTNTPNPKIKKITVTVFSPHSEKQLINLTSYTYVAP